VADAINTKKIPILADIRDESAEDVRIVLEPRSKNVDPVVLMESLFKQSDLETRISLNMNVLIDGVTPKVCSIQEVLRAFLDFRQEVLVRRSTHRLGKIDARLEVLEGYIIAYLNLDRVIEIIRYEDEPKALLIAEFELSDVQAEAILNMRLRNLRKLEEIEKEPITVVCSQMGWIRAMKGHIDLTQELKFKDGDGPRFIFHAETTDKIVLFGTNGRFYTLMGNLLPGGRGMGEPVRLMVDLPNQTEIVDLFLHKSGRKLVVASSAGDGFVVNEDEVIAQTRNGRQVLNVKEGVEAKVCRFIDGDHIAVVGENRKVLIFPLSELPEMGRGKGVRLQKYKDGGLSDLTTFTLVEGLSWKDPAGRTRTETELADWLAKRAAAGRMAPRGFPRDNKF